MNTTAFGFSLLQMYSFSRCFPPKRLTNEETYKHERLLTSSQYQQCSSAQYTRSRAASIQSLSWGLWEWYYSNRTTMSCFMPIMCAQACVCLLSQEGNKLMLIEWLMTARMRDSLMRPTRVEIKCQLVAQIKFPSFHQSPAHISLPLWRTTVKKTKYFPLSIVL